MPLLITILLVAAFAVIFLPSILVKGPGKALVVSLNIIILFFPLVPGLTYLLGASWAVPPVPPEFWWYLPGASWLVLLVGAIFLRKRNQALEAKRENQRLEREQQQQMVEENRRKADLCAAVAQYRALTDRFSAIFTTCKDAWVELGRAASALHGVSSVPFAQVLKDDTLNLLKSMAVANGNVPDAVAKVYIAVRSSFEPDENLTVKQAVRELEAREHQAVSLPVAVESLHAYDNGSGPLGPLVAEGFAALVEAAFGCFRSAMPVRMVRDKYRDLLGPYISENKRQSYKYSSSTGNGGRAASSNRSCPHCAEYYSVLRLQPGATEEQVKSAYKDLVQIYHPDRFDFRKARLRRTAEEEMKKVNAAYSHISDHFLVEQY